MIVTAERTKLTPRQIAKQYGVAVEKVIGWIKRGELRAINAGTKRDARKPRFLIDPADLAAFEASRAVVPAAKSIRRRKSAPGVREYF